MTWTVATVGTAVSEFLRALPAEPHQQALALIRQLEERGTALREPHSKALGAGLFELRAKSGVRIFYMFRPGRRILLLGAIWKKRQRVPAAVVRQMRARIARINAEDP